MHPELEFLDVRIENAGENIFRLSLKIHNKGVFCYKHRSGWTEFMDQGNETDSWAVKGTDYPERTKVQRIQRLQGRWNSWIQLAHFRKGRVENKCSSVNVVQATLSVELKWYQNDIRMISEWYQNDIKMISKWYQNDIKFISRLYQHNVKIISNQYHYEKSKQFYIPPVSFHPLPASFIPECRIVFQGAGSPADPKVQASWNKYYTYEGITELCKKLARSIPTLLQWNLWGNRTRDVRFMFWLFQTKRQRILILNRVFWIDGNIHSTEIQGTGNGPLIQHGICAKCMMRILS